MSIYPPTGTLEIKNATLKIPVVDLQYTSNTAKLEANSNVVTEFSRSKKLIKYPRVALTSGQSGLSGGYTQDGYTVQASSEWGGTHMTSNVFNGIKNYQNGTPPDYAWLSSGSPDTYTPSTGLATTVDQFQNENGSWVGLALPDKIKLSSVHLYNRRDGSNSVRGAKKGIVWGSDGGSTWYRIKDFGDNTNTDGALNVISVDSNVLYDHFRVQITEIHNSPQKDAVGIGELEFYGIPEYDPEAHGTDVTIKSYPNVPNTDWLEVYYDAKDLTSISGTVADLSGKSVTGSLNGDVSINTSNDVKSFSFDGSGDYIIGNLTNTGDFDFTVSLWLKKNTRDTVGMLWNLGGSGGSGNPEDSVGLEVGSNNRLDYFIFSGPECAISNFGVDYLNKWVHIVATRTGIDLKIYLDGVDQNLSITGSSPTHTLQLAANTEFTIGARGTGALGNNSLNGSIANFRIFNRALTSDEIYQLYAYQKEDFGHSTNNMTLKAGRLGIGTSEPRAALDVRGDIYRNGAPAFPIPVAAFYKLSASTSNTTHDENIQSGWVAFTGANTTTPGVIEAYTLSGGTTTQGTSSGVVVKLCKKGMYKLEAGFAINTQSGINSHIGIGIYPVSNSYIPGNTSRVHYTLGGAGSLAGYFYIPGATNNINQQFRMTEILRVSEGPGYAYVTMTPNSNNSTHFQFQNWASYPHGVMYVTYLG